MLGSHLITVRPPISSAPSSHSGVVSVVSVTCLEPWIRYCTLDS
jgi:hypothetical protein